MGPFVAPSGPREDDRLKVFEKRLLSERPAGVLVGAEDFQVVPADDPGQEPAPVGLELEQGTDTDQSVVLPAEMCRGTAPPTLARRVDQPGTYGVEFNILSSRQ